MDLTKRQQEIFDFIRKYSAKYGYPPTVRDIDRAVGGAGATVRGIVRAEGLPLLGSVAAGQPVLAEENIEEYVSVPEIAGGEDGEYLLRSRGDWMKDAGILQIGR